MTEFLANLDIPNITKEPSENLEKLLDIQEIESAVKDMQSGKAPGPDGFPIEFYKTFASQLAPSLLKMFNYSFDQSSLPQSLTEALIIVLLKPGKMQWTVPLIGQYHY